MSSNVYVPRASVNVTGARVRIRFLVAKLEIGKVVATAIVWSSF